MKNEQKIIELPDRGKVIAEELLIKLKVNEQPLMLFIKILERFLKVNNRPIDISNFNFEVTRVEVDNSSTNTGELSITLYPSDAFIRFVTTFGTTNFNS